MEYELSEAPPQWLFLKSETTDGVVGWDGSVAERRAHNVRTAIEELVDNYVLEVDPATIENHWQVVYRGGLYHSGPALMGTIVGVDQALWDIKGKHFGALVHRLPSDTIRDRARVCQRIGGDCLSEVAERAELKAGAGLTAVGMNATTELERIDTPVPVQAAVDWLEEVRGIVGSEIDIGVDFHGYAPKPVTKQLARMLEPYEPILIEESVLPEYNDVLPEIVRHTTIPTAMGERTYSHWDSEQAFEGGMIDPIQLDLSHTGGVTEVRKIASMTEAYDAVLTPYCLPGPIALTSCPQVDIYSPNALIQEWGLNIRYSQWNNVLGYLKDKGTFGYEGGYVAVSDEPGFGIQIDEQHIRKQAERPVNWHDPVWCHENGSVAEW